MIDSPNLEQMPPVGHQGNALDRATARPVDLARIAEVCYSAASAGSPMDASATTVRLTFDLFIKLSVLPYTTTVVARRSIPSNTEGRHSRRSERPADEKEKKLSWSLCRIVWRFASVFYGKIKDPWFHSPEEVCPRAGLRQREG